MVTPMASAWMVRGTTFLVWLLAAASVVQWGLRLAAGPAPLAAPPAASRGIAPVDPAAVGRLLGGPPAAGPALAAAPVAPLASRFVLVGIVAEPRSGGGAAVISVDGKPARPFRVGSLLDEGLVLKSVAPRQAQVAERSSGAVVATLELPALRR